MLRREIGAFNQNIARAFRYTRMFASHDTADIVDHAVIGNNRHAAIQRVGLAVQRQHLFPVFGLTRDEASGQFCAIIDVERATKVDGNKIGNVDQGRNRLLADGVQPVAHPLWRGSVGDACDALCIEGGAAFHVLRGNVGRRPIAGNRRK